MSCVSEGEKGGSTARTQLHGAACCASFGRVEKSFWARVAPPCSPPLSCSKHLTPLFVCSTPAFTLRLRHTRSPSSPPSLHTSQPITTATTSPTCPRPSRSKQRVADFLQQQPAGRLPRLERDVLQRALRVARRLVKSRGRGAASFPPSIFPLCFCGVRPVYHCVKFPQVIFLLGVATVGFLRGRDGDGADERQPRVGRQAASGERTCSRPSNKRQSKTRRLPFPS